MTEANQPEVFDHHRGRAPLLRPAATWRSSVFLTVNLVGFVVVNLFWRYVSTGQWVDLSFRAYGRALTAPAGQMLLAPLDVFRHPWMIPTTALMLAVIIFVPIVVAVLYRLEIAGAFVLVVAVVGCSPLLAAMVAVGALLAGATRMRSDMPFLALLLGLAPVTVYLALAYVGVDSHATLPLQRWTLMAPFGIALVLAILGGAVVLALARMTGFRPGVVWPVLAVLLTGPIVIFHAKVGADELAYALIANSLPGGEELLEQEILAEWADRNDYDHLGPRQLEERVRKDLQSRREALAQRCGDFLRRHPKSGRGAEIAWLAATAQSLQIHQPALKQGLIRYVTDYLLDTPASRQGWLDMATKYERSAQAALAQWHLGELALRDRKLGLARRRLTAARETLQRIVDGIDREPPGSEVFMPPTHIPSPQHYRKAFFAVRRLIWLMESNPSAPKALAEYLRANPHELSYAQRLSALADRHQRTSLGDNLKLAQALAVEDPYGRAQALIPIAAIRPLTDAAIEANYELGHLAMLTKDSPALRLLPDFQSAESYFRQVASTEAADQAEGNPWLARAKERLEWLKAKSASGGPQETDESEYSLLVGSLADGDSIFTPAILSAWARRNSAAHLSREDQEARVRADLDQRKRELIQRCKDFRKRFGASRRGAAVAWLAAQCHSLQLHEPALKEGLIKYETAHLADSKETLESWRTLGRWYPQSPQAALADWNLGRLALRREDLPTARKYLQAAWKQLHDRIVASLGLDPRRREAVGDLATFPTQEHYRKALFDTERLIWLIAENPDSAEPLAKLERANPYLHGYGWQLRELARAYAQTPMGDNLQLAVAMTIDDPARQASALMALAKADPPTDAAIEATYELGQAALRVMESPILATIDGLREPAWYFHKVKSTRANPWRRPAARHLDELAAIGKGRTRRPLGQDEYESILSGIESPQTIFDEVILAVWVRQVGLEHLSRPERHVRVRVDLQRRRRGLIRRCEDFLSVYPRSLYAPRVLYLSARAHSLQLDERAMKIGLIRYHTRHLRDVLPVRRAWRRFLGEYPDSDQAALAYLHLGRLAARAGDMSTAAGHLKSAAAKLEAVLAAMPVPAAAGEAEPELSANTPLPRRGVYRQALFQTRRLIWLMTENHVAKDEPAANALAQYLNVNPYGPLYTEQLEQLAARHAKTAMGDNLKLAVATAADNEAKRAATLMELAQTRPLTDAGVEACYHLGWLALRKAGLPQRGGIKGLKEPNWYFSQVVLARANPWQEWAREQLEKLRAATQPKVGP